MKDKPLTETDICIVPNQKWEARTEGKIIKINAPTVVFLRDVQSAKRLFLNKLDEEYKESTGGSDKLISYRLGLVFAASLLRECFQIDDKGDDAR